MPGPASSAARSDATILHVAAAEGATGAGGRREVARPNRHLARRRGGAGTRRDARDRRPTAPGSVPLENRHRNCCESVDGRHRALCVFGADGRVELFLRLDSRKSKVNGVRCVTPAARSGHGGAAKRETNVIEQSGAENAERNNV
ncbi:hypothetical protein EVAR_11018_1 [Eumeta japonica]|uniref:Uncharacterized protein n=1 Tax=Eumeta variegata TaxID=151549 RepID=A0A4C1YNH6_EUMVA|nr:hypothetical protein EVAR_11018_1 [Eumeta japonica]